MTEPAAVDPEPEPKPEAAPPEPAPAEESQVVRVALAGPWYVEAFQPNGKLILDRNGADVPAGDVEAIVASASKAGIALKVSKQNDR